MSDLRKAAEMALEALEKVTQAFLDTEGNHGQIEDEAWQAAYDAQEPLRQALEQPDQFARLVRIMGTFDLATGHADNWNDLLDSLESELRDVLGYYRETFKVEQECSTHPDAPHGFNRDASHNYGRYVCDCEGWKPSDDDAAWATHLKEPVSEKRVHKSDTIVPSDYSGKAGDYTEQEPVWIQPNHLQKARQAPFLCRVEPAKRDDFVPIYTTPPKREWVGLTDEEIIEHFQTNIDTGSLLSFAGGARYAEAKLKEKNHG